MSPVAACLRFLIGTDVLDAGLDLSQDEWVRASASSCAPGWRNYGGQVLLAGSRPEGPSAAQLAALMR